ncbi:hypothetical protein KJ765_03430 [Candidatus Micrarchaeota archaeon]|nr:hypothetical protein [Candidatus Micrarchaeota archaeon]
MLEDLFEKIQDGWANFLDWSEEKGLPFKSVAETLEEKGIPSLPAFVLILLLLIGGAGFFLLGGTALLGPQQSDVAIEIQTADGFPVINAAVYLVDTEGIHERLEGITDSEGVAFFSNVPIGVTFRISALNSDEETLEFSTAGKTVTIEKDASDNIVSLRLVEEVVKQTVSISLSVQGPPSAVFWIVDSDTLVPVQDSKSGSSVTFEVEPENTYKIIVSAEGYVDDSREISVGTRDEVFTPFVLLPKDRDVLGKVRVLVSDDANDESIANASVDIADAISGKALYTNLLTGENGRIPVQDVLLGTRIIVSARAAGFESLSSIPVFVEKDTVIELSLHAIPESAQRSIMVQVNDEGGTHVLNPIVRLYDSKGARIEEQIPSNGSAAFENVDPGTYYVTAYKFGFLPAFVEEARRGERYEMVLVKANDENSALVEVNVIDQSLESIPEASVGLFWENGKPMGISEKFTSADGSADFPDVPLERIFVKASFAGREGKSNPELISIDGTGEEPEVNLIEVILQPGKAKLVVSVYDYFTNQSLDGALVELSFSGGTFIKEDSCVTERGKCAVDILEGFYVARVSLEGYETLLSSEFEVIPGITNRDSFELLPSGARGSQIVFQGLYDLKSNKASSLSPSTVYKAKFLLTRPNVDVSRAEVHVRVGSADSSLDNELVEIVGYEAGTAFVTKGTLYDLSPVIVTDVPTETPSPTPAEELEFADPEFQPAYKYVHFTFQPFEGTKEIAVFVRTKAVSDGTAMLQYRSAFDTARETLRDPLDETASTSSILANMKTITAPISFGGLCEDDLCLDYFFEGQNGRALDNYEAEIRETFSLQFHVAAPRGTVVELSSSALDESITLTEGSSGGSRAVARSAGDQELITITTSEDNAEGQFLIQAQRLSNDVALQLQVRNAETVITRSLYVRVVGTKPDLKVTNRPSSLQALQDNMVTFAVEDSLGLPVSHAYVSVGNGNDALRGAIIEGVFSEGRDGSAQYRVEGIHPVAIGTVTYQVEAEGFKVKRGFLRVTGDELISVEGETLSLTVDSTDNQEQGFSVTNLLDNEVRVSVQMQFGRNPQYTDVSVDLSSFRLKARDTQSINLRARILDTILPVAARANTLSETVSGRLLVRARLGSYDQEESVPFTIASSFTQQDLEALWSASADSLQFTLKPPREPRDTQTMVVTNDADYPILINYQSTLSNVYMEPLSQTIAAGDSAEFKVVARAYPVDPCDLEDDERDGTLTLYASTLGITSRKRVGLTYTASSSENCRDVHAGDEDPTSTPEPTEFVTPTPVPTPLVPTCALNADPNRIEEEGTSTITVDYYDLNRAPNVVVVNCGNGRTSNAVSCTGTTGSCTASCYYSSKGRYEVRAQAGNLACLSTRVEIYPAGVTFTPTPEPGCVADDECSNDEICSSGVCEFLECGESEAAIDHTCQAVEPEVKSVSGGVRISLPMQIVLQLPPNTLTHTNPDGSTFIELPSGDTMLFDADVRVGDLNDLQQSSPYSSTFTFSIEQGGGSLVAVIPSGAFFEVPARYARRIPVQGYNTYRSYLSPYQRNFMQYGWELRLPVVVYLDFPTETEFAREGAFETASINDFDIKYPTSSTQYRPYSGEERRVRVNAHQPIQISLTPIISSQDALEVEFPVEATFIIEEFIRVKKDSFSGGKALQFQSGNTISLPSDAIISMDARDFKRVTIPAGSALRIPSPFALRTYNGEIVLSLPFRVLFLVRDGPEVSLNIAPDGVRAKSISTDYLEMSFLNGVARAGLKAPDGSRTVEVMPLTQIIFGRPDFGMTGNEKRLPVGFDMTLPFNVNARYSVKDDRHLLEFPSNQRMLVKGASIEDEEFGERRDLKVPPSVSIVFDYSMLQEEEQRFGEDRFTVTFPQDVVLHFPVNARVVKNAVTTYSYNVELPFRPVLQAAEPYKDLFVERNVPITFVMIDEDLAGLQGVDFVFHHFPNDVDVNVPQETFDKFLEEPFEKNGDIMQSYRLSICTELAMEDNAENDLFEFNGMRLMADDVEKADETEDAVTFSIPVDTRFVTRICQDTDKKYKFHATFTDDVVYLLPEDAPEVSTEIHSMTKRVDLQGCREIQINVRGETSYQLPQVKEIWFSDMNPFPKEKDEPQQISVPADSKTTLILCERPSRNPDGFAMITDNFVPIRIKPKEQTFEFTDSNVEGIVEKGFCVLNDAPSEVSVYMDISGDEDEKSWTAESRNALSGESISSELEGVIRKIRKPSAWDEGAHMILAGKAQQDKNEDAACQVQQFLFSVQVPQQYTDDDGCLLPQEKLDELGPLEGDVKIFYDYRGSGAQFVPAKLILTFEKTGSCVGSLRAQLRDALGGFYVNYDRSQQNVKTTAPQKLVFKDLGHKRWISMANNLDESVTLNYQTYSANGTGFLRCDIPTSLRAGEGYISECESLRPWSGYMEIKFKGSINGKTDSKFVNVESYEIDPANPAMKNLFSGTPLGDLILRDPPAMPPSLTPASGVPPGTPAPAVPAHSAPSVPPASAPTTPVSVVPSGIIRVADAVIPCSTNFCTADEAKAAFKGFGAQVAQLITTFYTQEDEKFNEELNKFCNPSDPVVRAFNRDYRKSVVVQMANTKINLNDLQTAFQEGLGEFGFVGGKKSIKYTATGTADQCGIYIATARLGLCELRPNKEEWLKSSFIEMHVDSSLPSPTRFLACEEKLYNTNLLTADTPEVIIGREPNPHIIWTNKKREGDTGFFEKFRIFSIGPYREAPSADDERHADLLLNTLYGYNDYPLSQAVPFEDTGACIENGGKATGALLLAGAPGALVAIVGSIFAAPVFAPRLAQGVYSLVTGITGCTASIAVDSLAPSRVGICEGINACISFQTFALTDFYLNLVLPTGAVPGVNSITGASGLLSSTFASQVARRGGNELIGNLAVTGALSAILGGSNTVLDSEFAPGITPATVPIVAGASKVFRPFGSRAFMTDYFMHQGMSLEFADALVTRYTQTAGGTISSSTISRALVNLIHTPGETALVPRSSVNDFTQLLSGADGRARMNAWVDLTAPGTRTTLYNELTDVSRTIAPTQDQFNTKIRSLFTALDRDPNIREKVVDELINNRLPPNYNLYGKSETLSAFLRSDARPSAVSDELWKLYSQTAGPIDLDFRRILTPDELANVLRNYDEVAVNEIKGGSGRFVRTSLNGKLRNALGGALTNTEERAIIEHVRDRATKARTLTKFDDAVEQASKTLADDFDAVRSRSGRFRSVGNAVKESSFTKKSFRGISLIGSLVAPLLFYTEVRPVRAELDYRFGNHLVVYHNEEGQAASMKEYCFRNEKDLNECANRVDTEELCPDSEHACLYLTEGTVLAGIPQYNLVTSFNKGVSPDYFITSMFDPNVPVASSFVPDPSLVHSYSDPLDFRSPVFTTVTGATVTNAVTLVPASPKEAVEALLKRFREWCINDGCPQAVEDAIPVAQKQFDDTKYPEALNTLRQSAGVPIEP